MWSPRRRVFISYRRADAGASAGRLFDWLVAHFGRDAVFLDTEEIPFGDDFRRVVAERLAACDVVLAVMGRQWSTIADERGRRLDRPDDPVRFELERALESGRRIVPVLVDGAVMPASHALPASLQTLCVLNAASLRDASFAADFDALVDELEGRRRGALRTEADHLRRLVVGAAGWLLAAPVVAVGLAFAAWTGVADLLQVDTLSQRLLMPQRPVPPAADTVLLVVIDEASERRLGRRFEPAEAASWRADHARLVDRAAQAGARALVFDLFFERPTAADEGLAAAMRSAAAPGGGRAPLRTVLGVRQVVDGRPLLVEPLARVAAWGTVCLQPAGQGRIWSAPLAVLDEGSPADLVAAGTPSLALAAVAPADVQAVDRGRRELVFAGPPPPRPWRVSAISTLHLDRGECVVAPPGREVASQIVPPSLPGAWQGPSRRVSYADALDASRVPDAMLAGRVLLVGVDTPGVGGGPAPDRHVVRGAFSGARSVAGVELQADALAALLGGRAIVRAGADAQALAAVVASALGAVLALVSHGWSPARRRLLLVAAACAWLALAWALARADWLMRPAYDLAALLLGYLLLRGLQRAARRMRFVRGPAASRPVEA